MIQTGIDLLLNKRLDKQIENPKFLKRVFHPWELKNKNKIHSIFALKEATMKALGKKHNWLHISITYKNSKPHISLNESITPKKMKSIACSVSHDGDYTTAIVLITTK